MPIYVAKYGCAIPAVSITRQIRARDMKEAERLAFRSSHPGYHLLELIETSQENAA